MQDEKMVTNCVQLGNCNDMIVAKYVRVVCAVAFQNISQLLSKAWAFAIAVDGSDCQTTSYIEVRVRLYSTGRLLNYHLISIPFSGSHTGSAMFNVIETVLNALCANWKSKLIACSTDGAANMTGRISGLVTRIANVGLSGFVRIWCALHQIDLVMQKIFRKVDNSQFYPALTGMISHLRRQKTLIDRLKSRCPMLSGTRWVSMSRVSSYLLEHRIEILDHYQEICSERCKSEPLPSFWIYLAAVNVIATDINDTVQRLQGKQALLGQQSFEIEECIKRIRKLSFAEDVVEVDSRTDPIEDVIQCNGLSYWKRELYGFLADQGLFVVHFMRGLQPDEIDKILENVAEMFSTLIVGLQEVRAERDESNCGSVKKSFPTLPLEFVEMRPRELIELVEQQHARISVTWNAKRIENICSQQRALKLRYEKQSRFKSLLSRSCDPVTANFDKAWGVEGIDSEYPDLCEFAGGLASIFPNTASVESDFSVLKWEKDEFRHSLSDFSLEGILQCRQMLHKK